VLLRLAPAALALTRRIAQALQPELCPEQVFDDAPPSSASYELRAMVCYYGSHYAAYARTDEPADSRCALCRAVRRALRVLMRVRCRPAWTRFDDTSVTRVGGWEALCDACARGHLQPTTLFYEREEHSF